MGKNRVSKCFNFLLANKYAPWVSWEGLRLLKKNRDRMSATEVAAMSSAIELDVAWGSRDPTWRDMMRTIMWLDILLCKDGKPPTAVAHAALTQFKDILNLTTFLQNRMDRYVAQENDLAVTELSTAATRVRTFYGADLDSAYAGALTVTFVKPLRPTCFRWHKCAKTDAAWTDRITKDLPNYGFNTGGKTGTTEGAFTLPWTNPAPDVDLAGTKPPYNRCIEFAQPETDYLIHELLHWCTHKDFWAAAAGVADQNERILVKEGTTEWLKRELTKQDQGDYADVMPKYRKLLLTVDPGDVKKAYFRGAGVAAVIAELLSDYRKREDAERKSAADEGALNHLKTKVMKDLQPWNVKAKRFLDDVYKAFKDASATDLAALPNGWGTFVTQRKTAGAEEVIRNHFKTRLMTPYMPTDARVKNWLDDVYEAFKGASAADLAALPNGWGAYVTQRKTTGR
jgi:hypothetical protein